MGVNLMNNVPTAVQAIANDEQNRQPDTENTEHAEHNHRSGFKSPRSLISKIGNERQIKCRNSNQKEAKKICSAFAENNCCEMKMDPAAARIPTHTYKTMIADSAI